ncbi:MAG: oxidoreductase [Bacteroidetes bacterium MED-G13]|nr:MAG: oxidoreductase [Bacteroidetes bacterium MED-G13]
MLHAGVIGCGHLGKFHIKQLSESKSYQLTGVYDKNLDIAKLVSKDFACDFFDNSNDLISKSDIVCIVTPTPFHFEYAKKCIESNVHIFIEKPVCNSLNESKALIELNKKRNLKIQVGHVERFNPAFTAIQNKISNPMFIESHRLAQFNPRGTDVSVVLDLMIHDIDIILSSVDSEIKKISSSGVSVISSSPDIANARIEFKNGCVANLTASRVSIKNMRKTRFFQTGKYISIDFLNKSSEIIEIDNVSNEIPLMKLDLADGTTKNIFFSKPNIKENNAILDELNSFADSITNDTRPVVDLADGHKALSVANEIIKNFNS